MSKVYLVLCPNTQRKTHISREKAQNRKRRRQRVSRGGAEIAEEEVIIELDNITGAIGNAAMNIHMDSGRELVCRSPLISVFFSPRLSASA